MGHVCYFAGPSTQKTYFIHSFLFLNWLPIPIKFTKQTFQAIAQLNCICTWKITEPFTYVLPWALYRRTFKSLSYMWYSRNALEWKGQRCTLPETYSIQQVSVKPSSTTSLSSHSSNANGNGKVLCGSSRKKHFPQVFCNHIRQQNASSYSTLLILMGYESLPARQQNMSLLISWKVSTEATYFKLCLKSNAIYWYFFLFLLSFPPATHQIGKQK